jgi:hypothetical protein
MSRDNVFWKMKGSDMHRILVGLAVAVAVLAIGAVVAVALLGNGDNGDLPNDAPLVVDAGEPTGEVVDVPLAETEEAMPDVPIVQEDMTPPVEAPPVDKSGESPAAEDAADGDTADRIAAIVDSLSEEEEQALVRELQQRRMRRHREIQKYRLPSGQRLYSLQWYKRGEYKLDDTQKARVEEFDEIMRPKIEAALQGMWSQETDLRQQITDLRAEGRREEVQMLYKDLGRLNKEIRDVKSDLDVEYNGMLRRVLTADQMAFMEASSATRYRTWVGQPPQGNRTR